MVKNASSTAICYQSEIAIQSYALDGPAYKSLLITHLTQIHPVGVITLFAQGASLKHLPSQTKYQTRKELIFFLKFLIRQNNLSFLGIPDH